MRFFILFFLFQLVIHFPISAYADSFLGSPPRLTNPAATSGPTLSQASLENLDRAEGLESTIPPQISTLWRQRQYYLQHNNDQGAHGTLIVIKEMKKRYGIENMTLLSQVLIWEAMESEKKGNHHKMEVLISFSQGLSPDFPPVYYYQARIQWTQTPWKIFDNIRLTITALTVYIKDFSYFINGLKTIWVVLFGTLFISLFVILGILVIRSFPILGHQLWEWSGRKMNLWNQWGLVGIIALLPIFLDLKPFWIIFVWVSLTWFWLNRLERIMLFSIYFLLIGIIYSASNWGAIYFNDKKDDLQIMVDAVRGEWVSLNRISEITQEDKDWPILFTQGSIFKRKGDCLTAIKIYEKVKNNVSGLNRAMVQNNIGNCYFHLKKYSTAVKEYEKNIEEFPSFVLPYYNLSQAYREQLLFDKGREFYQKALDKDEMLVFKYSSLSTLDPQFLVIDDHYGQNEIWKRILSNKNKQFGETLWTLFTGEIPKVIFVMLFSFWAGSILIISWKESEQSGDIRCQTCSKTMCIKCQHYFFDLTVCEECWEGLKIKKVKPLISMNRTKIRSGATPFHWIFSCILPGSGHLLKFLSFKGVFWVSFWSFLISFFIFERYGLFKVTDGISGIFSDGGIWIWVLAFACYYLFFFLDLKREFQN